MSKKNVLTTVGVVAGAGVVLGVLAYVIYEKVFFGGRDKYGVGDVDAWRKGFSNPWRFADDEEDFDDFDDFEDFEELDEEEDTESESLSFDEDEDCL